MTDPSEKFRLCALESARAESEADRLEGLLKITFAELVNQSNATSVAKAENEARASERYRTLWETLVHARTAANIAKAELESMRVRFEYWRTREATKRAEMKL